MILPDINYPVIKPDDLSTVTEFKKAVCSNY